MTTIKNPLINYAFTQDEEGTNELILSLNGESGEKIIVTYDNARQISTIHGALKVCKDIYKKLEDGESFEEATLIFTLHAKDDNTPLTIESLEEE